MLAAATLYSAPYAYLYNSTKVSFTTAMATCASWYPGATLASIASASEESLVYNLNPSATDVKWIGLVRNLTNTNSALPFYWVDGSPVSYTNFAAGQPLNNSAGGTNGYTSMGNMDSPNADKWANVNGTLMLSFVCKRAVSGLSFTK